jgi:hypothetical protein
LKFVGDLDECHGESIAGGANAVSRQSPVDSC